MKYIIYKITNLINSKIYVGKHQTINIDDDYYGSGVALQKAIKKYGKSKFKKEILFIFDNEEEMNRKEIELVTEDFIKTGRTYNIGVGGEGGPHFKGRTHSEDTKRVISEKAKGRKFTEETRKKLSESNKKRVSSEETKCKLSEKAKLRFSNKENLESHSKRMIEYYKNKIAR